MIRRMSLTTALARIAELEQALRPPPAPSGAPRAGAAPSFASRLAGETSATAVGQATVATAPARAAGPVTAGGSSAVGARIVATAAKEVGQAEQPPGSNDSPRIAEYRTATAGAGVGPWCAYFVSWAARQAGAPLGERGQGFGAVSALYGWAQRTGRAQPAGSYKPQPGDFIVWGGRHMGLVESVDASGNIHTIEGNSSDQVIRRSYGPDGGGATGYVHLG